MKKFVAMLQGISLCRSLFAQTPAIPSSDAGEEEARQERIKWWRDSKFGMFICWGLYSIPAGTWKDKVNKSSFVIT
jgi:alpha-L-fucosidase